jgi:aminoglycoside 6'-N-acetyltransferase I
MRIIDLASAGEDAVRQAAAILHDVLPEGWPALHEALDEARASLEPDRISRVAVDDTGVLGWTGGQEKYERHVWELHPLAVRRDAQRRGIGRALVLDLEERMRERGVHTVFVGADDLRGETSLAGVDLYPDPLAKLQSIRNPGGHPYEFYQRLGYIIVGVVPDANGFGRPDIYLTKRIA